MRTRILLLAATAPLAACDDPVAKAPEVSSRSVHQTRGNAHPLPAPTAISTLAADGSANRLRTTLDRIRAEQSTVDAGGATETLVLDEKSFAQIVDAFGEVARRRPEAALAVMEPEPGELRSAVIRSHFGRLLGGGGRGPGEGSERDLYGDALAFVESISDDDERRGAGWLLTRELLENGEFPEAGVAQIIAQLDDISSRTARHMVAVTANQLRNQ